MHEMAQISSNGTKWLLSSLYSRYEKCPAVSTITQFTPAFVNELTNENKQKNLETSAGPQRNRTKYRIVSYIRYVT